MEQNKVLIPNNLWVLGAKGSEPATSRTIRVPERKH